MSDETSPHVKRASSVSVVAVIVGVCLITLLALAVQSVAFPKTFTINSKPSNAKIYLNKELVCQSTPCDVSLHPMSTYHLIIDRPGCEPRNIHVFPFNRKKIEAEAMPIVLKANNDPEKRDAMILECQSKRAELLEGIDISKANFDAEPCYRVPAIMPWQAENSGHCHVMLDIDTEGHTTNIRMDGCTEGYLADATRAAAKQWRYLPKLEAGVTVERYNVKTRMVFKLNNYKGVLIPEAPKFADDSNHTHDIEMKVGTE